jgi:chromosome segregation ATPase
MKEVTLQVLDSVKQKIDQIAVEKSHLKAEISGLQNTISRLTAELEEKNFALNYLNEELNNYKMSQPQVSEVEDKQDLKLKVEEMIKEIDKCISLLNN